MRVPLLKNMYFLLFVLGVASSASAAQAPEVKDILSYLSESVRSKNYQGRLTYEHSGKLEVIEISHGVRDGIEYERITYLNGPEREVHNVGKKAGCRSIGSHLLAGGLVQAGGGAAMGLSRFYDYRLLGAERVAGHMSWLLQLVPRDEHRHSMILAVDQKSYLPTKSMFVASGRKVLERLHFVSLNTDTPFDDTLASAHIASPGEEVDCTDKILVESKSLWRPTWLPEGFVLSSYDYSDEDGHMETYTDGLASFSIFFKPLAGLQSEVSSQVSTGIKKGATVVVISRFLHSPNPVEVTVLGEIPQATAKQILAAIGSQ